MIVAGAETRFAPESQHQLRLFLLIWISTAAVAVQLSALETVFRARRVHSGFASCRRASSLDHGYIVWRQAIARRRSLTFWIQGRR
jgi:hypothetical protein